jgi:hypothetical protein
MNKYGIGILQLILITGCPAGMGTIGSKMENIKI